MKKLIDRFKSLKKEKVEVLDLDDKTAKKSSKLKFIIIPLAIVLLLVIGVSNSNNTNIIDALRNKILSGLGIYTEEVRNVEIESDDYSTNTPGSWHINKSADWISEGKATITFDVNSVIKRSEVKKDVILVLDISGSMDGDKLNKAKSDAKELVSYLLEDSGIKVSIISFSDTSTIASEFSNNENELLEKIDSLTAGGQTNYNAALLNVDEVMKNYVKEDDKDVVTLFLTDGYPNIDVSSQIGTYEILKDKYSYMMINGIQYEMGTDVIKDLKDITDNQWVADQTTLNNTLFEASTVIVKYDSFKVIDYIDKDNFSVNSVDDIKVSLGTVKLEEENGLQKITWDLGNNYNTGSNITMDINVTFKKTDDNSELFSATNDRETIISKLPTEEEKEVASSETPVLKNYYNVTYLENAPSGCSVVGIPSSTKEKVFSTVDISSTEPTCEGYEFKGYEIVNRGVTRVTKSKFIMPDEDVVIRAIWSKVGITKSAEGQIYTGRAKLKSYNSGTITDFHLAEYAQNIVIASFINYVNLDNAIELSNGTGNYWDLSYDSSGKVIGWLELDETDDTKYHLYIGTYERKLWANEDSSYLFFDKSSESDDGEYYTFMNLKEITFDNFDTSQVTSMESIFSGCNSLTNIVFGDNFNTSEVTTMAGMFDGCRGLEKLDLSKFNTSQVTTMAGMFWGCISLTNIVFGDNFNTSQVTNMTAMFFNCSSLEKLDISKFNTSQVTSMHYMFAMCSSLTSFTFGDNFNTSQVSDMSYMFAFCTSLTNIVFGDNFNTSNVTDMGNMFSNCSSLEKLDVRKFNTSQVTDMNNMFGVCSSLTTLNISNFNTRQVTMMYSMFSNCRSLTSIVFGDNFNTSQVTTMSSMFSDCSSLTSIVFGDNFNTSQVTDMGYMFLRCSGFTSLDLSSFNTSQVTDMSYMFSDCSSLTNIVFGDNFNTSQVTDMRSMFYWCSELTDLNLSSFNTSQVTTMQSMFFQCSKLTELDLSSFDMSKVTSKTSMLSITNAVTTAYARTQADADILNTDTGKPSKYTFIVKPTT